MKNKIIKYILMILPVITAIFAGVTSFRLAKYGGLDLSLRLYIIVILACLTALVISLSVYLAAKNKFKSYAVVFIIAVLFCFGNYYAQGFLGNVYEVLDKISTKEETYAGALVVLRDSKYQKASDLKGENIGYFNLKESMEGYIIPSNILNDAGILDDVVLLPYEDIQELIGSLYNGDVDAIMISANYVSQFENTVGFETIEELTRILEEKEETTVIELTNDGSVSDLKKPFTVMLMGVDSVRASESGNITGNADALFVATINPENYTATITSIPRDSYVPIMCYGDKHKDKITHANVGGTGCVVSTVANMFDIDIDYYVKVNFRGLVDIVDALGGVYVNVDPEKYPDGLVEQNGYRYYDEGYAWIHVPPGNNLVSGEQALAYARCRKRLEGGATERAANQSAVINSIIQRIFETNDLNSINKVLDAAGKNIQTNLTVDQMVSFYKLGIDIIQRASNKNMSNAFIIDYYLVSGYDRSIYNDSFEMMLYYYVPFENSIKSNKENIWKNLEKIPYNNETYFSYVLDETYYKDRSVFYWYNEKQETFEVPDLVINMNGYDLKSAIAWAKERNIPYDVQAIRNGDSGYNEHLSHNTVIGHDQKIGRKTSKISSITFYVIKHEGMDDPVFNGDFSKVTVPNGAKLGNYLPKIECVDPNGKALDISMSYKKDDVAIEKINTAEQGEYKVVYTVTYNEKQFTAELKVIVDAPCEHTYVKVDEESKNATCTEDEVLVKKCSKCGAKFTDTVNNVKALGHSGEWVETKPATCTEEGVATLNCTRCGELTKTLPLKEHTLAERIDKEATTTEAGLKVIYCSVCGKEIETVAIPALPLAEEGTQGVSDDQTGDSQNQDNSQPQE